MMAFTNKKCDAKIIWFSNCKLKKPQPNKEENKPQTKAFELETR